MKSLSLEQAREWVKTHSPTNFSGHQTVKLLGIEPATSRESANGYDVCLTMKVRGRLEFGKEYSIAEIEAIGVDFLLITKL